MKYAHLADLHLGSWKDEKMRELSIKAFISAVDDCIFRNVDFLLFSGDLFNTSLPALDLLKIVTKKLKELSNHNIPLYVIAGSHDFSPSGKTMIDVLENAGLLRNVCKGDVDKETKQLHLRLTVDEKTGVKITGILGRSGQLDKTYYQNLNLTELEKEIGYKIFMFHTTLTELKPKHMEKVESQPASFLPKGFNYYAGGHVHHRTEVSLEGIGTLTYPGALFPNNFMEMEKYGRGGYFLISCERKQVQEIQQEMQQEIQQEMQVQKTMEKPLQNIEWVPIEVIRHTSLILDCSHKSPEVVLFEIANHFNNQELADTIITIRLKGRLARGKVSDINFRDIFDRLYKQGAYFIMKNTAQLNSEEFEEIMLSQSSPEDFEENIIREHLQQVRLFSAEREMELTRTLLKILNVSKKEGENTNDFQRRIKEDMEKILGIQ